MLESSLLQTVNLAAYLQDLLVTIPLISDPEFNFIFVF